MRSPIWAQAFRAVILRCACYELFLASLAMYEVASHKRAKRVGRANTRNPSGVFARTPYSRSLRPSAAVTMDTPMNKSVESQ